MQVGLLKSLGFSDKSAKIYLALLNLGPSSVRKIAEFTGLNRGTVYDSLKELQEKELIRFYHEKTKQNFIAESPEKLKEYLFSQEKNLRSAQGELEKTLPELLALYNKGGDRPIAKYFSKDELKNILEDVLKTCESNEENLYRIYSAAGVREYLYDSFQTFSDVRIAKNISVKVIALGVGGELRGLDERKWLPAENNKPTYIIIYPGKTAYISLDAKSEPVGVIIENQGIFETQKMIFENLWDKI